MLIHNRRLNHSPVQTTRFPFNAHKCFTFNTFSAHRLPPADVLIAGLADYCIEVGKVFKVSFPWGHAFRLWEVAVPLPSRAVVHANCSEVTTVKQHRKFPKVIKAGRWVFGAVGEYVLDNWWDNFHSGSWGQAWASFPAVHKAHIQSEPLICPSSHHHKMLFNIVVSLLSRFASTFGHTYCPLSPCPKKTLNHNLMTAIYTEGKHTDAESNFNFLNAGRLEDRCRDDVIMYYKSSLYL